MVGCRNPITKCYFLSLMASRRSRRALSRSSLWLTRRACSAVLADASKGIFENQLLVEQSIFDELGDTGSASTLLDMGCGRGRIAQHAAPRPSGNLARLVLNLYHGNQVMCTLTQ